LRYRPSCRLLEPPDAAVDPAWFDARDLCRPNDGWSGQSRALEITKSASKMGSITILVAV